MQAEGLLRRLVNPAPMEHADSTAHATHHGNMAVLISNASHPKTLQDLDTVHKDPMYELVTGARQAYFIKHLANKLATKVSHSGDVTNIASLVNNSARELERNWRMAACMANTPVSTGYPYLPTMPAGSVAAPVPGAAPVAAVTKAGISVDSVFPLLITRPVLTGFEQFRRFI